MICFPNAKINLGLQVIEKSHDNFHNIASVIVPVNWLDVLEFQESVQFNLTVYGINRKWKAEENLVTKAWQLLKNRFNIPPLEIHLLKSIPVGSGLGGGSADAAFFIKEINEKFELNLSSAELINLASELGSDCAFFIENRPAFISGRGNVVEAIELNLKKYFLFIVKPDFAVSTGDAYQHIQARKPAVGLKEIILQPIDSWRNNLKNDFEDLVFEHYPELGIIKEKFYEHGAIYASMSGSGSAIYGIFENELNFPPFFKKYNKRGGFLFQNKTF
ncbi:MAG TPA: 4-(cytidine 5'-diphospho)-2-C-methyl-D-erythritol kinase [Bacteroidales bacterium]